MSKIQKIVASNIVWYRKRKGYRQADIAKHADINYRYYQDIEAGKKNITLATLQKISDVLDVSLEEMTMLNRIFITTPLEDYIEKQRTQLDSIQNFIVAIRDMNMILKYVNQVFLDVHGVRNEEVIGLSVDEFLNPNNAEWLLALNQKHIEGDVSNYLVFRSMKPKSKEIFTVVAFPICLIYENECVGILAGAVEESNYTKKTYSDFESQIYKYLLSAH